MMYGDQQQQHPPPPPPSHLPGGDFHRGMPMRPPLPPQPPPGCPGPLHSDYMHGGALPSYDAHGDGFAAKRIRKLVHRQSVDHTSTTVRYMQLRMWQRDARDRTALQPTPAAAIDAIVATYGIS